MTAIFKRELNASFSGWRAYLFIALTLMGGGLASFFINVYGGNPTFEYVIPYASLAFFIAIPLFTMGVFVDERRQNTDRLLMSLPIRLHAIVLGKYLALLVPLAISSVLLCAYPLALSLFGEVPFGTALGAICAYFSLGAALMAMGLFMSALAEHRWVAFVTSALLIAFCYLQPQVSAWLAGVGTLSPLSLILIVLGIFAVCFLLSRHFTLSIALCILAEIPIIALRFAGREADAIAGLTSATGLFAAFDRLGAFMAGLFDLTAIAYYLSAAALFVCFACIAIGIRWNSLRGAR